MIGIEFVIKSIEQLKGGEQVVFGRIAVIVTVISIVVKELMAQFAFWAGAKDDKSHSESGWLASSD